MNPKLFWAPLFFGLTALAATPRLAEAKWIDLTHPFDETTIYWPNARPFELKILARGPTPKGYWYESNEICASEHGGTHLDAPVHFAKGKWSTDEIPLKRLIGPACVLDVSKKTAKNPDYEISPADIESWEKENGRVPVGCIFLTNTGWARFWPDKKKYLGTDKPGDVAGLHFPGYSREAAETLASRGVAAVGLDTPSQDPGQSKEFWAHRVFGIFNIAGFENVDKLHRLPPTGARIIALPMKITRGSGGPLRIIAELP